MLKKTLLKKILGSCIEQGKELLFYCPKCDHKKRKLSVNLNKDAFKCWVCNYSGRSIYRLVRQYGDEATKQRWRSQIDVDLAGEFRDLLHGREQGEIESVSLPKEFKSLVTPKGKSYFARKAAAYLSSRGLTKQDLLLWKPGYCDAGQYAGRIIFPSFDRNADLNYFVGRTFIKEWPPYRNAEVSKDVIFNEFYLNWSRDVVLVEGVFDAINAGPNSIPMLGSFLREKHKLFKACVKYDVPVYLALDPDAEDKEMGIAKMLLGYDMEVYKINVKPYKDVGEMPREVFAKRKQEAVKYNLENFFFHNVKLILEG